MVDQQPEQLVRSTARTWKKAEGEDLKLPSGNVALVRRVAPEAFLASGVIPDPLTAIIRKSISDKKGLRPEDAAKILLDPKQLSKTFEMFDRVLCFAVIDPVVKMPPACDHKMREDEEECGQYANKQVHTDKGFEGYHEYHEGARDLDVLYADTVEIDDKMFIFNFAMSGTRDVESFRKELDVSMGDLLNLQTMEDKTEQPAGN